MDSKIIVRDEAQKEIAEIFEWYESKEPGLGHYFILCLDASLEQLARNPGVYRIIKHEYRRFFVRKFPIGVFYILKGETVYIDVVEPLMRDPKRLAKKLGG